MLANDYFNQCLEEDKQIIQTFLTTMCSVTNYGLSHCLPEYVPFIYHQKLDQNAEKAITCAYLLTIARAINKSLNAFFKKHNLPSDTITYSQEAINMINERRDKVINQKIYKYFYEFAFSLNNHAASMIKAYSEYDRPICVERILINMIKDGVIKCLNLDLNIEELINDLEVIACQKEGKVPPKMNKKNISIPYGENLTAQTFEETPLIGREKEFRKICAGLMDEEKSVIIHGKHGVGKTTLVKGLAYKIQNGTAPLAFQNKQIIQISGTEMISGCKYVGMVEERMKDIIHAVLSEKDAILFIDEIHTLMGLGQGSKEHNDVSNILKPYLGDGRIKIIGATTTDEYHLILENGAFARRFSGIEVPEPTDQEVFEILEKTIKRYQEKKQLTISYDQEMIASLLKLIIEFSKRKNPNIELGKDLYNPDLALTILRNGYNFAQIDRKSKLDASSLIEGFQSMDYFRDGAKEEFEQKVMRLTRKLTIY